METQKPIIRYILQKRRQVLHVELGGLNLLWLDVDTEKGRKLALIFGALVLAFLALVHFLLAVMEVFPAAVDVIGLSLGKPDQRTLGRTGISTGLFLFAVLFGFLARRFWRTRSRTIARIGFIWVVLELMWNLRADLGHGISHHRDPLVQHSRHAGAEPTRRAPANREKDKARNRLHSASGAIANPG